MTLELLIGTYGYLAILIGTLIEGETIVVLGGIAAKLGYLKLQWVIIWSFTGTLLADQLFFFAGRYRGTALLQSYPSWQQRARKAGAVLERHRILIILGFRFLYGLRTMTPFVIGMSPIPVVEFLILNIIGAALWATVIASLGYAFGHGLELILGDIRRYEIAILATVLCIAASFWLYRFVRLKNKQK